MFVSFTLQEHRFARDSRFFERILSSSLTQNVKHFVLIPVIVRKSVATRRRWMGTDLHAITGKKIKLRTLLHLIRSFFQNDHSYTLYLPKNYKNKRRYL